MSHSETIKELAAAVSIQTEAANRLWLTLMTIAVFAVLRIADAGQQSQEFVLPFGLGTVSPATQYPVLLALLVILIVAFTSAHAQQVRARKLARRYIDKQAITDGLHPVEFFEILCQPSVIRVGPLALSVRGKYQFFETIHSCPDYRRWLSAVYYLLLKASAILIYFLVPGWVLVLTGWKFYETNTIPFLRGLIVLFPIALLPLVQVICGEISDAWETFLVIKKHVAKPTKMSLRLTGL